MGIDGCVRNVFRALGVLSFGSILLGGLIIIGCKTKSTPHKNQSNGDSITVIETTFPHLLGGFQASDLGKALFENDTSRLDELIRGGKSFEDAISDGLYQYDLFYQAIVMNNIEMAWYVLSKKLYSVNKVYTEDAETPLTMTSSIKDPLLAIEFSKILLENGAKVDGAGPSGGDYTKYPILIAVAQNNVDLVRLYLSSGAKTDIQDELGMTPLTLAESKGFEDVAALLRENLKNH